MKIERGENEIRYSTKNGCGVISSVTIETSAVDTEAYRAWAKDCAKRIKPVSHTAAEAGRYLAENYDVREVDRDDRSIAAV